MKFIKRNKYLAYGSPKITKKEIKEVSEVLKSGWIGTGPKVQEFQVKFAKYKKVSLAQAVSSCTSAIHLSLLAAKIKKGDEVITSSMTFCATINAIIHAGGIPKLIDIDPDTGNIDYKLIEPNITKKTKFIIPVHYAGYPCEMEKITEIAKRNKLIVIEDCAHAIETKINNKAAGTFGEFGCFSFYVTKNLVTGEGGMVISNNKLGIENVKTLSLHGMTKDAWKRFTSNGYQHYSISDFGFKNNMTDIAASIGIIQLADLETNWKKRKLLWNQYYQALKKLPIGLLKKPSKNIKHAYHLFPIFVNKKTSGVSRDDLISELHLRNIGIGVHYKSIASYPIYKEKLKLNSRLFRNSIKFGNETLSLPISAKLTQKDINYVISAIKDILNKNKIRI